MSSGFTGAQRLDERRRRRLATESDETSNGDGPANADDRQSLPSPEGLTRGLDGPQIEHAAGSTYAVKPAGWVISRKLWKHIAVAATLWLTGLGITWVGTVEAEWVNQFGPGASRLFGTSGAVQAWFGSAILLAASNLAVWIWWMRRQAFRDFAGSYRVWPWMSASLLVASFATSTGAHWSVRDLVAIVRPEWSDLARNLIWVTPTITIGGWLTFAMQREMRGCRGSLWIMQIASLLALGQTALALNLIRIPDATLQATIEHANLLTIQVGVLLSLALHLRHVSFFNAEPTEESQRRLRIPNPHFRWAALLKFRKPRPVEGGSDDEESPRRKGRRRRKRKFAKRPQRAQPTADHSVSDDVDDSNEEATPAASAASRRVIPPTTVAPPRWNDADEDDSDQESDDGEDWNDGSTSSRGFSSTSASQSDDEDETDESDGDNGGWSGDEDDLESLRDQVRSGGLSKKQRRKLQNRIRDIERRMR
jgi:hypothetical protein